MSLPPAEKLPLTIRKDVREKFEERKRELEQKLQEFLGVPWTIDVNPLAIWPYAESDFAKQCFGQVLSDYVYSATVKISGAMPDVKASINEYASAHVLTLAPGPTPTFRQSACKFMDGKLAIIFEPKSLGVNASDALEKELLTDAVNEASTKSGKALTFVAQDSLTQTWYPRVEEIQAKIKEQLGQEVKLNSNIEENYAKLKTESKVPGSKLIKPWDADFGNPYWETGFGQAILGYWQGLATQLNAQGFKGDEMLTEGFFEVCTKREISIRIVDSIKQEWVECVFEDGVLYIQTAAPKWGTNVEQTGKGIIDLL